MRTHVDTERLRYVTVYVRGIPLTVTRQTVPRPGRRLRSNKVYLSVCDLCSSRARRRGRKPRRLGRDDTFAVECERRKTRRTGRRAAGDDGWQRGRVGGRRQPSIATRESAIMRRPSTRVVYHLIRVVRILYHCYKHPFTSRVPQKRSYEVATEMCQLATERTSDIMTWDRTWDTT